jgi:hypothetical protein
MDLQTSRQAPGPVGLTGQLDSVNRVKLSGDGRALIVLVNGIDLLFFRIDSP